LQRNAILAALVGGPLEKTVIKGATLVDLAIREQIYRPDERIDEVFFPTDSVLSVVARMMDGHMIEVGTIGREGTSAIPLLLGATSTANECYCQVPGSAVKINVKLFKLLATDPRFRQTLDRFVQSYVNMLGQLVACSHLHSVLERCARWLLMSHDRVGTPEIRLTQEYLAMMLGAQRSAVTIAAAILQKFGLIRHTRGVITILNRSQLEGVSCECYGVARAQFDGLFSTARQENAARASSLG
jgi:CRP-like cAMP-binding protein